MHNDNDVGDASSNVQQNQPNRKHANPFAVQPQRSLSAVASQPYPPPIWTTASPSGGSGGGGGGGAGGNRPKAFTPYTSYLAQIGSASVSADSSSATSAMPTTPKATAQITTAATDKTGTESKPSARGQPVAPPPPSMTTTQQPILTKYQWRASVPTATPANRTTPQHQRATASQPTATNRNSAHYSNNPNNSNNSINSNPATNATMTRRARKRLNRNQKRKLGEHTAGQLQQLDRARLAQELFQRGGGVTAKAFVTVQRSEGGSAKLKRMQELHSKQDRAAGARKAPRVITTAVINLDSDDDNNNIDDGADDDEVICVPMTPPPLVCIDDSSGDEQNDAVDGDKDGTGAGSGGLNDDDDDSRSSSIAEDFVRRRDRDRLSLCLDDNEAIRNGDCDADDDNAVIDVRPFGGVPDGAVSALCRRYSNENGGASGPSTTVSGVDAAAAVADGDHSVVVGTAIDASTSSSLSSSSCTPSMHCSTPKRNGRSTGPVSNQSYEVAENGFAAIDVYESESSDFPESVYDRTTNVSALARATAAAAANRAAQAADNGQQRLALDDSESDVSSIVVDTANRPKRRLKRRSSCSHRASDDNRSSDDYDDDDDDDDDDDANDDDIAKELDQNAANSGGLNDSGDTPAYVDILRNTNTPFLQRGEAVANAKTATIRVPGRTASKRRRSLGGRSDKSTGSTTTVAAAAASSGVTHSDDEFMSMLSCIVHNDTTASPSADTTSELDDSNAAAPNRTQRNSEKADARSIVENVLSKAAAAAAAASASASTSTSTSTSVGSRKTGSGWKVTDEVVVVGGSSKARVEGKSAAAAVAAKAPVATASSSSACSSSNDVIVVNDVDDITTNSLSVGDGETADDDVRMVADAMPAIVGARSSTDKRAAKVARATAASNDGRSQSVRNGDEAAAIVAGPLMCWNDEMQSFYNTSWGGESYSSADLLRSMPKNRARWPITERDLFTSSMPQQTRRFNRKIKCHNCREKGHRAAECPMPPKAVRCHMCGQAGHREPRCPNTICLRCGSKTKMFNRGCQRCRSLASVSCPLCQVKGHTSRDCPDKWRRYHSTTQPNVALTKLPVVHNKPKYCCVCASPGHLAEYCRNAVRLADSAPAQPMRIQSYEESYERNAANPVAAPFVQFSAPLQHYAFNWSVNESPDRLYGRVMKATKLLQRRPVFDLHAPNAPHAPATMSSASTSAPTTTNVTVVVSTAAATSAVPAKLPSARKPTSDGGRLVLNPLSVAARKSKASAATSVVKTEADVL